MKRIGLIGGMSWESSAEYYRLINEMVRDRLGGLHSADCLMLSVDFARVEAMQASGRWDDAALLLAEAARVLEGGADFVVLCTNTMHKVAAAVGAAVGVPLLHLADTTAETVLSAGVRRVGLLGTAFTMEEAFYRERLEEHGLDVVLPVPTDRARVHRVIYDELCLGVVNDDSRAAYRDVIGRLVAAGADGVILGCTEIELLVGQQDSPVPVFPTTSIHARAAVDLALA